MNTGFLLDARVSIYVFFWFQFQAGFKKDKTQNTNLSLVASGGIPPGILGAG